MTTITYSAPSTVGRFMESESFARFIVGPVGSGKTTGCIFELLKRCVAQAPGADGKRRTRWAIVRQTLQQLRMTILLDILSWLRPISHYKVSDQLVIIEFGDVYSEWFLIPLEDPEDQRRLLSMQLTGAWLSEAIEMSPDLVDAIAGRCGRFPSANDGGCTWFGMIGDTNAPTDGSDWWRLFEDDKPLDWQVFWQPGGLDPAAENLEWLLQTTDTLKLPPTDAARLAQGRTYYERLARGHNLDWVNRYVHARYGNDPSGSAVFRGSFKRMFHVKQHLMPVVGMPLLIGQDFGRSPCSVIAQQDHSGRLNVLEEVIAEDIGLELHVSRYLKPRIYAEKYAGMMFCAVGDPAGRGKSDILEENNFDVMKRLGIPAFPAPTNNIDPRITSVETLLLQQRDGGPALAFDEFGCPTLIRAMNGMYRFGKTHAGITKPLPDKTHPWSDVADALQYICLSINSGLIQFIAKRIKAKGNRQPRARVSSAGWT
jgi:hypothetical protein